MNEDTDILNSNEILTGFIKKKGLDQKDGAVQEYLQQIKYPPIDDFENGLEWFNTSEALSFKNQLEGKLVLLDFFTYCCINCMHILPDLKDLENEFSIEDGLVVVGVHSAKFENEKLSKNIISAIQRYNISHPVVNDYKNSMWKSCNVGCWPTLLLVGPKGVPIVMLMGEGHRDDLQLYIQNALEFYKSKKLISNHKIALKSAYHFLPDLKGPLLFPGKITSFVEPTRNVEMLAISDTGNHRILVLQEDGLLLYQVGGPSSGFVDGNFQEALFNSPQGLAFQNSAILYVADTENHAIRKIDLNKKTVTTVVGTGEQGIDYKGGEEGTRQVISSPWDVCVYKAETNANEINEIVFIAMAGLHQIWALFLENMSWWKKKYHFSDTCAAVAGSGREENKNNQYPFAAGFAQPSGLALSQKDNAIYIADSECSSIRKLSLEEGKVSAVVGGDINPQNLFAFGDKDGKLYNAKLQHVLGVAAAKTKEIIFVADSYNHKIKQINTLNNTISTVNISNVSNSISFNEPGGLCLGKDDAKLYVADTNNHDIKILYLDNKCVVTKIKKLEIRFPLENFHSSADSSIKNVHTTKCMFVNPKGGKLNLKIDLELINDIVLTAEAPQKWNVHLPDGSWSCVPFRGTNVLNVDVYISLPPSNLDNVVQVDVIYNMVICKSDLCIPKKFIISQPIQYVKHACISSASSLIFTLDELHLQQKS